MGFPCDCNTWVMSTLNLKRLKTPVGCDTTVNCLLSDLIATFVSGLTSQILSMYDHGCDLLIWHIPRNVPLLLNYKQEGDRNMLVYANTNPSPSTYHRTGKACSLLWNPCVTQYFIGSRLKKWCPSLAYVCISEYFQKKIQPVSDCATNCSKALENF